MVLKLPLALLHPNLKLSPPSPSPSFSNHHLRRRFLLKNATLPSNLCLKASRLRFGQELTDDESEDNEDIDEKLVRQSQKRELAEQSIWSQMKEIVMFTGPATGLWICGPLMSLIDTAVIGQGSSIELAALGSATVVCDYMSYVFMFLSVATSNMVATALAKQDREELQHHISVLLFVGLACGIVMLLITRLYGAATLTGIENGVF